MHICSDCDHSLTNDYNINTGPPEICRLIYSGRWAGTQSVSCRYHQLACQDWFERLIFCSSHRAATMGIGVSKAQPGGLARRPISLLQVAPFFSIFRIASTLIWRRAASENKKLLEDTSLMQLVAPFSLQATHKSRSIPWALVPQAPIFIYIKTTS